MPRAITVDGVDVTQLQIGKDSTGNLVIYCELQLKSGGQVVQRIHRELSPQLSTARKAAVRSLFDAVVADVVSAELL